MSSRVITPEAVLLELPTAGVATRSFARLFDLFCQLVAIALLSVIFVLVPAVGASPALLSGLVLFMGLIVLPILTEVLWRGSSPGKAVFGLRVVNQDGSPELPRQAVVRGIVALVDLYLSLGSIALLTAMFSSNGQRSGDMSAGTVVIRSRSVGSATTPIAFHSPVGFEQYVASLDVGRLTDEDFSLIREFLLRVTEFTAPTRAELAQQLASATVEKIQHQLPGQIDPEVWLVCVASAYQLRQGGLLADAALGLAPLAAPRPTVVGSRASLGLK